MNTGNSVQDRANLDHALEPHPDAADEVLDPEPVTHSHVQDIQDIVDKLAAVTRKLREPGHS
jgi:hypothetical protein